MKTIVVGMNPSNKITGSRVRKNSTFDRLTLWMNTIKIDKFSFINTFHCPKDNPKLSDVDFTTLELARPYKRVLALGGFASAALKKAGIDHFVLPHPSPRNRKLNDKSYEKSILEKAYKYIHNKS